MTVSIGDNISEMLTVVSITSETRHGSSGPGVGLYEHWEEGNGTTFWYAYMGDGSRVSIPGPEMPAIACALPGQKFPPNYPWDRKGEDWLRKGGDLVEAFERGISLEELQAEYVQPELSQEKQDEWARAYCC